MCFNQAFARNPQIKVDKEVLAWLAAASVWYARLPRPLRPSTAILVIETTYLQVVACFENNFRAGGRSSDIPAK